MAQKKCERNNQWAGQQTVAKGSQYHDKTEFSNEWVSTNKIADESNTTKKTSAKQKEHKHCQCSHKHE